jgi:hypothetical protein
LEGLEAIALSFTKQLADSLYALRSGEKKPKITIELKKRGRAADQGSVLLSSCTCSVVIVDSRASKRVSFPGRWHGAGARPIGIRLARMLAFY